MAKTNVVKAQGTDLFFIDPDSHEVKNAGCITSLSGIDTSIDQIETTCLNETARSYVAGLATPGTATFAINTNPQDPVHIRLLELKNAGVTLDWAVGWSDGTVAPTAVQNSDGDYEFDPDPARSWLLFEGYMNSFSFGFELNTVVTSSIGIQVSGEPVLIPKSTS
ncbi:MULTISPECIES: phage tail tube protein [Pseudomonas]|uniref:Phage tail protein n=1 Tax=Pseudomonas putida TaxID=303 RepID=A0A1X0ZT74_PSEPU|nr:phage tail tube protein [Pseudomonas putida]ORL62907.1 hypothetical protein B7H17_16260 [Pseudomonas putida]